MKISNDERRQEWLKKKEKWEFAQLPDDHGWEVCWKTFGTCWRKQFRRSRKNNSGLSFEVVPQCLHHGSCKHGVWWWPQGGRSQPLGEQGPAWCSPSSEQHTSKHWMLRGMTHKTIGDDQTSSCTWTGYVQEQLWECLQLGVGHFRDKVVRYGCIGNHLMTSRSMIMKERRGRFTDRLAKSRMPVRCWWCWGLRQGMFTRRTLSHFLNSTRILQDWKVRNFWKRILPVFYSSGGQDQWEAERATHYLDEVYRARMVEVVEEELIKRHMKTIVEMEGSGVVHMLKNNRMDDLACMSQVVLEGFDGR